MNIVAVIPARYNSSRFVGKPLADIHGKPMLWWVYNQVKKVSRIKDVIIAIDDKRIEDVCTQYNMKYINTSETHNTSTERLYEVSQKISADLYICINGDEPLIEPYTIEQIIPRENNPNDFFVSNLMTKILKPSEAIDNTNIKVVFNNNKEAIFMSRSPIPFPKSSLNYDYYKHIGVLCYTKKALDFFYTQKKGRLEAIEDINELRFLENNIPIKMIEVDAKTLSVDTYKDLEFIREYMITNKIV